MKNFFFAVFALALLTQVGCRKDDDETPGGGNNNAPITLECSIQSNTTLTDQNPDGVDYIIDCPLDVSDGNLRIEEGTLIQVNDGNYILIGGSGSLTVEGSGQNPVRITGQGGSNPSWGYIFINTTDVKNKINHAIIENAGIDDTSIVIDGRAAVVLEGRLEMTNTTISNSGADGFLISQALSDSELAAFAGNTIRNSAGYPINTLVKFIGDMDLGSCTFTGNGEEFIRVSDDNGTNRLQEEASWEEATIPYLLDLGLELYNNLSIEAGAELVFTGGSSIQTVSSQSTFLKVNGTQNNHVIMRGEVAASGAWNGLLFSTSNVQNELNWLDISDGGQDNLSFADSKGNITLEGDNTRLVLNDCTSTRAECDVVLSTAFGEVNLENNSPSITEICVN